MLKIFKYSLGVALLATTLSCSKDVDLNGEYPATPVIYGLLDPAESIHVIRINKTFLGTGNAYDFAKVADSSYIFGIQPVLKRFTIDAKGNRNYYDLYTRSLKDTVVGNAPEGTFYGGSNRAYYFVDNNVTNVDDEFYEVSFEYNGKIIRGATAIVGKIDQYSPKVDLNFVKLVSVNTDVTEVKYSAYEAGISPVKNGKRVEFNVLFTYTEEYLDNSPAQVKTINISSLTGTMTPSTRFRTTFSGLNLLGQIANQVVDDNPNVKQRIIGKISLQSAVAGTDLSTYIEVNNPSSGVIQERPEFTNIDGGVGIFSSRNIVTNGNELDANTQRFMCKDQIFINSKFCSKLQDFASVVEVRCN